MTTRRADLTPPLGKPGGPCQVVQRIQKKVTDPSLRDDMTQEVQDGVDLSNLDAGKVYSLDVEPGVGPIRQIRITGHAQYRMDLRSITVADLRTALTSFMAQLQAWQTKRDVQYGRAMKEMEAGKKVEWTDPKLQLKVVFELTKQGVAVIISTFWKNRPNPGPVGDMCQRVAARYLAKQSRR